MSPKQAAERIIEIEHEINNPEKVDYNGPAHKYFAQSRLALDIAKRYLEAIELLQEHCLAATIDKRTGKVIGTVRAVKKFLEEHEAKDE